MMHQILHKHCQSLPKGTQHSSHINYRFSKMPFFYLFSGFDWLIMCLASKACCWLYLEDNYANFQEDNTPETQRRNLTALIMIIKALGVKNVLSFHLMSVLTMQALLHGLESFYALGVLDTEAELTILGKEMYVFCGGGGSLVDLLQVVSFSWFIANYFSWHNLFTHQSKISTMCWLRKSAKSVLSIEWHSKMWGNICLISKLSIWWRVTVIRINASGDCRISWFWSSRMT